MTSSRKDGCAGCAVVFLAVATMAAVVVETWWLWAWEQELIWANELVYDLNEEQQSLLLRDANRIVNWLFWPLLISNVLWIAGFLLLLRNQRLRLYDFSRTDRPDSRADP